MNSQELRDWAIEVIAKGIHEYCADPEMEWEDLIGDAIAALAGLGAAGFKVLGPEITDDMWRANNMLPHNTPFKERFPAMVIAGDLTKPSA